jgi:L,D-transpeptidase YcbB
MVRAHRIFLSLGVHLFLSMALMTGLGWAQAGPAQDQNRQEAQQPSPGQAPGVMVQDIIRSKVQLCTAEPIRVGDSSIPYSGVLAEFYATREYLPAWTNPQAIEELIQVIRGSEADGLLPEDYHLNPIETLRQQAQGQASPELTANLDILMTDALFRLSHHLLYGKINPQSLFPDLSLSRTGLEVNLPKAGQEAIDAAQITALLEGLRPQNPYYLELKRSLVDYRAVATQGGWPSIPPGPVLKKGKQDRRVPVLRNRLAMTVNLEAGLAANPSIVLDEPTVQAVRRFQSRHSLKPDGVVDAATLEALNLPAEQRIDQIRVNLERTRWVLRDAPRKNQVVINIATFNLDYADASGGHWETRVVVGEPYRKTPVIESKIDSLIFNPTWNVPQSIAESEILPMIEKNPGYLRSHNFRLVARDPLQIVQEPGPGNALGRVKFIFPNSYDVYLHDTPNRKLFGETTRTFSHGCIRVENALRLAVLLLNDPEWNLEKINRVLRSRKTVSEKLKEPVPIAVVYRTVQVIPEGGLGFLPDIYQRDFEVLSALQRP